MNVYHLENDNGCVKYGIMGEEIITLMYYSVYSGHTYV